MSQGPLYATARRLTLSAAVAAAAAACTTKTDAPAASAGATSAGATSPGAANAGATGTGAPAAGSDSASGAVVTHSAPPTVQDRQVAVPGSGRTADTNHSGMAVSRGARKAPR